MKKNKELSIWHLCKWAKRFEQIKSFDECRWRIAMHLIWTEMPAGRTSILTGWHQQFSGNHLTNNGPQNVFNISAIPQSDCIEMTLNWVWLWENATADSRNDCIFFSAFYSCYVTSSLYSRMVRHSKSLRFIYDCSAAIATTSLAEWRHNLVFWKLDLFFRLLVVTCWSLIIILNGHFMRLFTDREYCKRFFQSFSPWIDS